MRYFLLLVSLITVFTATTLTASAVSYRDFGEYNKKCMGCHNVDSYKMGESYSQATWIKYFAQKGKALTELHSKTEAKKYFNSKRFKKKSKRLLGVMLEERPKDKYKYGWGEKRARQERAEKLLFDKKFCYVAKGKGKYFSLISGQSLEKARDYAEESCEELYGCSRPVFMGLVNDLAECRRKIKNWVND